MSAFLALVLLASSSSAQDDTGAYERAMVALDGERYGEAWAVLEEASTPLEKSLGHAAVLLRAGDPVGALRASEAGLGLAPDNLELLFDATYAALWLRDADRAEVFASRLEAAVERGALTEGHRAEWRRRVESFRDQAEGLARTQHEKTRALARARLVAAAVLVGSVGALILLAFRGGRAGRSGTPAPGA